MHDRVDALRRSRKSKLVIFLRLCASAAGFPSQLIPPIRRISCSIMVLALCSKMVNTASAIGTIRASYQFACPGW